MERGRVRRHRTGCRHNEARRAAIGDVLPRFIGAAVTASPLSFVGESWPVFMLSEGGVFTESLCLFRGRGATPRAVSMSLRVSMRLCCVSSCVVAICGCLSVWCFSIRPGCLGLRD